MKKDKRIKIREVVERVQIGKSTIYNLIKKGQFPKPIKIGGSVFWKESDINFLLQTGKVRSQKTA